jgi:hypothetical protein
MQNSEFQRQIFQIHNNTEMERYALELFRMQSERNLVYAAYVDALKIDRRSVRSIEQIPFLPIEFFKTHRVVTGKFSEEMIFTSSGTTGMQTSRHYVRSTAWYKDVFTKGFELFYGHPSDYCILALLPSYLERQGSSLIMMVEELIKATGDGQSGFFLNNHEELYAQLEANLKRGKKTLLIGVTFGLLDFAERYQLSLCDTIVMETGGMKGRREELTRQEVADILIGAFQVKTIHSEYGMTELMSQAYSKGNGIFKCPPWMMVLPRDSSDPLTCARTGRGVLNVVDLANTDSCAFIATQDVGRVMEDGSFEVLGRVDRSDVRGCNLLVL